MTNTTKQVEFTPMSEKTLVKKSNTPIIVGVIAVILVVLGILTFQFVMVPKQVADSVNKNIESYNKVVDKSTSLLKNSDENFSNLFKELGQTQETDSNDVPSLAKIKSSDFDSTISTISSSKNSLDKGPNKDTQDFQEAVSKSLDESKSLIESYKETNTYIVCISDNFLTQTKNLKEFGAEANKLRTLQLTDPAFLTSVNAVSAKSKENTGLTSKLSDCFTGNFAKYKTSDVDDILKTSVASYTGLSDGYDLIAIAIKEQDTTKLNDGVAKVTGLGSAPAIFEKRFGTAVIDKPLQDFGKKATELEKLDNSVKSKRDDIKKKYNL